MAVKALLFDFDGTLLDSESPSFRSWQEIYAEHGQELALERWVACVGTVGGFDPLAELERLTRGPLDREAVGGARLRRKLELIAEEPLRPGVDAYIRDARALGLRVGIVTSSALEWVEQNLARLSSGDGWDCILCANHDPAIAKPSAHLYEAALVALDVEPSETVAFEDSPNGIAAAKSAGIFCVAVPNPITAALDLSAADLLLESFEELPLAEVLARAV